MEREHAWARTLSVTTAAARTEPLGVDFVEGEEEEGRKEGRKEGSAPELEPGALGGPGGERAASSALIKGINELLAADGDGVGRNARRRAAPAKRRRRTFGCASVV